MLADGRRGQASQSGGSVRVRQIFRVESRRVQDIGALEMGSEIGVKARQPEQYIQVLYS